MTVGPFVFELSSMHHNLGIARRFVGHIYRSGDCFPLGGEAAVIFAAVTDGPLTLEDDN